MNIRLLEKLYTTLSPSAKEEKMADLIKEELDTMRIEYDQDKYFQISSIIPGKPLFVAHMDQVQTKKCHKVMSFKNRLYGFDKKGNLSGLGADDKNGIFIILSLLRQFKGEISFIFSANEERGGYLGYLTPKLDLSDTPYGLVFDRKGNNDIIGVSNEYCCEDLETAISIMSGKLKYRPAQGIFSDCDELSEHVPCVNLSCGYYNAHSAEEYTKIADLHRAQQLAENLINSLPRKSNPFELPDKFARTYVDPSWTGYGYSRWGMNTTAAKKYNVAPIADKETSALNNIVLEDFCVQILEDGMVGLVDDLGEEHFLTDFQEDMFGTWVTDFGSLTIEMEGDTINANIEGVDIEIMDFSTETS